MNEPLPTSPPPPEGFEEEECDVLYDVDLTGNITMVHFFNQELAQKLGYGEREIVGRNVADFLVDAQTVAGIEHFGQLYASEKAFRATGRKLHLKNGEILSAESYLMPLYDFSGKMIGHRGMEFFKLDEPPQ